ncbi:MAG: hypothetical protein A7316_04465 [Candidatus Altiarchaeales archaeon WOR_SM1_86-2]|nr:MAG: hypothetical protein A7316_04465 [Candidatus Altiarchaeales archaeon WOR_SM1_86-2]
MPYCIKVNGDFSAAHFLTGERIHGHNFSVEVRVCGRLNEEFMVMDFSDLKNAVDEICDKLDHRVLISSKDAKLSEESIEIQNEPGYIFPRSDVAVLPVESTTTECLAKYIHLRLRERINKKISVSLSEKEGCSAAYSE